MFLTVTPNASLDRILFIERFEAKTTMRTRKAVDAVGGKGHDISMALRCLGQETVAVSFRAGQVGAILAGLLASHAIQADLVEIEGETRIAHVIIEESLHRHSHITTTGYSAGERETHALLERVRGHLPAAAWLASGGSLPEEMPADFYGSLTRLAHEHHVPVLVDTSGAWALQALAARPDIVKMNLQEFRATFDADAETLEAAVGSCQGILGAYDLPLMVITHGREGILAVRAAGTTLTRGPALQEVNAAGAGDAASAALVWRLSLGDGLPEALRWAAAAGAAAVLTEETAVLDPQMAREILPRIEQTRIRRP